MRDECPLLSGGGGVGYIFIQLNTIFTTPPPKVSPDILFFSTPPPSQKTKTFITPGPMHTPLTSKQPLHIYHLPNLCPSDLNQTCMKHIKHLFTFCRLINGRLLVYVIFSALFFSFNLCSIWKSDAEYSLKLLTLTEATAVVPMTRHLEI